MVNSLLNKLAALLFSALILINTKAKANIMVSPTRLTFNNSEENVASLTIQNQSDFLKAFQVKVYKIPPGSNGRNEAEYQETTDLIATPMIFNVTSGLSQLIRVAVDKKDTYSKSGIPQKLYVLEIKEIPLAKFPDKVGIIMRYIIPVYIKI